jgi:hypothetical protein
MGSDVRFTGGIGAQEYVFKEKNTVSPDLIALLLKRQ